jgi:hypothetical protein
MSNPLEQQWQQLLKVEIVEAEPNKMFSEDQRPWVRFLRFNKSVPCKECGRQSRLHWTLLMEFLAHDLSSYTTLQSGQVHQPLSPVCTKHLLGPAITHREYLAALEDPEKIRAAAARARGTGVV